MRSGIGERMRRWPALGIGGPWVEDGALFNAYFILNGGDIQAIVKTSFAE